MTQPGIETRSPRSLANTLPTSHLHTDCSLYYNSSVLRDARSWDRNLANFYASRRFYRTATRKLGINEGILSHIYHFCFVYIYVFNGNRVLNSFDELCITWVTIGNSLRESSTTGSEHILSSTDRLFHCIPTLIQNSIFEFEIK